MKNDAGPAKAAHLKWTEAQFTTAVIKLAQKHNWKCAHFRPARTAHGWRTAVQGDIGFVDVVLAKEGRRPLFWELKAGTNRPNAEQQAWGKALGETYRCLWPQDWDWIEETLKEEK